VLAVADEGWRDACRADSALAGAINTYDGAVVSAPVAAAHDLTPTALSDVLG
jgi:alanine dehydrogenase